MHTTRSGNVLVLASEGAIYGMVSGGGSYYMAGTSKNAQQTNRARARFVCKQSRYLLPLVDA